MTDEDLFKLVKQAHRDAVRIPPGVREIADAIWQASRRSALKEAALCADKHADAFDGDPLPGAVPTVRERNACRGVADAIRALSQKEVGENP